MLTKVCSAVNVGNPSLLFALSHHAFLPLLMSALALAYVHAHGELDHFPHLLHLQANINTEEATVTPGWGLDGGSISRFHLYVLVR